MNKFDMNRHALTKLAADRGYETVADFARDCDMKPQCVFANIREIHKPSMERMFLYANVLSVPIDDIIRIFYQDEWEYNESEHKNSCCKK